MCSVEVDMVDDPNRNKDNTDLIKEAERAIRSQKENNLRKKMESVLGMLEDSKRTIKEANKRIDRLNTELEELKQVNIEDMVVYSDAGQFSGCCETKATSLNYPVNYKSC